MTKVVLTREEAINSIIRKVGMAPQFTRLTDKIASITFVTPTGIPVLTVELGDYFGGDGWEVTSVGQPAISSRDIELTGGAK